MYFRLLKFVITLLFSYSVLGWMKRYIKIEYQLSLYKQTIEVALDVISEVVNENYKLKLRQQYTDPDANSLKLQPENDYCLRSDTYKYFHPDVVLKDLYVVREIAAEIPKQIVKEHTFDLLPYLYRYQKENITRTKPKRWPIKTTQIFMNYEFLFNEFLYGKQILCLFQKFNHIPGKQSISHKNYLMDNFHRQLDQMKKEQKPEICIKNASYIPKTYRLYKVNECIQFFSFLNSTAYKKLLDDQGPQFITKAGSEVHRGRGITVIFRNETADLQETYDYGHRCGIEDQILIAQKYINNPFLYKGHKIEFRIYFLITSTNPLIVHAYKKALIKRQRCAKPFSIFSTEKASHVCNTAIVRQTIQNSNEDEDLNDEINPIIIDQSGVEEEDFFIDWYLEGLQSLLLEQKKIKNSKWLEEYLYPQVYKQIIHLVRSGRRYFFEDSRVSEFFAVDFLLNEKLEIYILECNYNPQILSVTPERIKRNYKMVLDTLEILQAYTRSRYIRIKRLLKKLINETLKLMKWKTKKLVYPKATREAMMKIIEQSKFKFELLKAFKERMEPSIKINDDNLYEKIIDENLKGPEGYHNLIQQECF